MTKNVRAGPAGYSVVVWTRGEFNVPQPSLADPQSARFGLSRTRPSSRRAGPTVRDDWQVFANVREPGADSFGSAQPIAPPGSLATSVSRMAEDGKLIVMLHDQERRVHALFGGPGRDFESERLSGPGRGAGNVVVGADGTAVALWVTPRRGHDSLDAAVREPGGAFGEPVRIASQRSFAFITAAATTRGRAVVAWEGSCPEFDPKRQKPTKAIFTRPDGSFGRPQRIPGSKCPTFGLDVKLDEDGRAIALIDGSLTKDFIRASYREPGGRFSPAERISRNQRAEASLVISDGGAATAGWIITRGGRPRGLEYATREAGGRFGSATQVVFERAIGAFIGNQHGDLFAVWQSGEDWAIKAAYKPPGQPFGAPEAISEPLTDQQAASVSTSVSPEGRAMVAWSQPQAGSQGGVFVAERASEG